VKILMVHSSNMTARMVRDTEDALLSSDSEFVITEDGIRFDLKKRSYELKWMSKKVFHDMWNERFDAQDAVMAEKRKKAEGVIF